MSKNVDLKSMKHMSKDFYDMDTLKEKYGLKTVKSGILLLMIWEIMK